MDDSYQVPAGEGEATVVEKRSEFIGHLWRVETEAEAREKIEAVKKKFHDARHNCWCYRLHGGAERYSDDGEPQGTAGMPMLSVFQKAEVENVCCVVTRYFGGILLGAPGLVRAYTQCARDTLANAGLARMQRWTRVRFESPYNLYERARMALERQGGALTNTDFGAAVCLEALLPAGQEAALAATLTELSAGAISLERLGFAFQAGPLKAET